MMTVQHLRANSVDTGTGRLCRTMFTLLAAAILAGCGADTGGGNGGQGDTSGGDTGTIIGSDTGVHGDTGTGDTGLGDTGSGDTGLGDTGSGDTGGGQDTTPALNVTGAHIEPATVNITTSLGVPANAQLTLFLDYNDGSSRQITAGVVWVADAPLVATVDNQGLVTANGTLGGMVAVEANYAGTKATRLVSVRLVDESYGGGLDAGSKAALDAGTFDPAGAAPYWEYPEHGTIFPSGVTAPVIQWGRSSNQYFKLSMSRGTAISFSVYTTANEYQPTPEQWRALTAGYGEPILLNVHGKMTLDPGEARKAAPERTVYSADANLSGTVYYWQINTGDIMRIDEGSTAVPVFSTNANTGTCRGCHTLSRDGSKLAWMYNGGDNPQAGLTWTSAPEPPLIGNYSGMQWDFMTFDPSGNRLVAVYYGFMSLWDVSPGVAGGAAKLTDLPEASPSPTVQRATTPTWSPDGSTLAYIRKGPWGADLNPDWAYMSGDLWLWEWDAASGTFPTGDPARHRQLLAAEPWGGTNDTISYPSWSPDSKWIAVGVGPSNRDMTDMKIHLVDPLTAQSTQLARGANHGEDVFPSFSPFIEGGYYWLLFYSSRPYGHITPNPSCLSTGTGVCKQLWVMAIDANMTNGMDGSHPAFWLPGQLTTATNITGYWAPKPCHGDGQECSASSQCCSGLACAPNGNGVNTCQADQCARQGEPCSSAADCCEASPPLVCLPGLTGNLVCQLQPN